MRKLLSRQPAVQDPGADRDLDQQAVIALLEASSTYGAGTGPVERIDTHVSVIFLAGDRAYKLKRAVRYDYLDFSTAELRRGACYAEVKLNRRTAPGLYLGVRPVTWQDDDSLALGGTGRPVDWVIEMVRFDQDTLLDRLAVRGALDPDLMSEVAAAVARLHALAEWRFDRGGRDGMAWVINGNRDGLARYGDGILDPIDRITLNARTLAALDRHTDLLDRRRLGGLVRWCHGDLHLGNICLIDGRPTLFDCIEFSADIACIDVLYDLAFLLMDLLHRGLGRHANLVLNHYLVRTGDLEGLALLPLFLSCRAAVRAKTTATAAHLPHRRTDSRALQREARRYLSLALELIAPAPPRLVVIGGFSGSGKSTLALGLAPDIRPEPGAVVLRSDMVRKSLLGVEPFARLDADGYTEGVTRHVYRQLKDRALIALQAGHSVVVDAVFGNPFDRAVMSDVAKRARVPFVGLWLDADRTILMDRLLHRDHDVSDATADVLAKQLARDIGPMTWTRLDASGSTADVRRAAIGAADEGRGSEAGGAHSVDVRQHA